LYPKFLRYKPESRLDPLEALCHPFFDELREPNARLPNSKPLPPLFNFTDDELNRIVKKGLVKKLIPTHVMPKLKARIPKKTT